MSPQKRLEMVRLPVEKKSWLWFPQKRQEIYPQGPTAITRSACNNDTNIPLTSSSESQLMNIKREHDMPPLAYVTNGNLGPICGLQKH